MRSNPKHTAEPWQRNISAKYPIYAETGDHRKFRHIASVLGGDEEAEANLRRIVACVNACVGIPTRLLEERRVTILAAPHATDLAQGQ